MHAALPACLPLTAPNDTHQHTPTHPHPHTLFLSTVPPEISSDSKSKSYTVAMDTAVTLECQVDGHPAPTVSWHRDGKPVEESVRVRVLSSGALHIAFAQPGDTGKYTCSAANVAGTASLDMSLTIQSESGRGRGV